MSTPNISGYNTWSATYDQDRNATRDLEGLALRELLADLPGTDILELGCGTGKNTVWLAGRCQRLVATDFSPGMLDHALAKVDAPHVEFMELDLRGDWPFADGSFDGMSVSLVLEHIADLGHVFREASRVLRPGGWFYIGELHPFKQYLGTKARFETAGGTVVLDCHVHHVGEFVAAAEAAGLRVRSVREFWDGGEVPRILGLVVMRP
jgi:ubiquinone/menaquinone biosynthesis C-methylase UbiE